MGIIKVHSVMLLIMGLYIAATLLKKWGVGFVSILPLVSLCFTVVLYRVLCVRVLMLCYDVKQTIPIIALFCMFVALLSVC
jgi:hypothetical protein